MVFKKNSSKYKKHLGDWLKWFSNYLFSQVQHYPTFCNNNHFIELNINLIKDNMTCKDASGVMIVLFRRNKIIVIPVNMFRSTYIHGYVETERRDGEGERGEIACVRDTILE